ncbi:PRTRC system protein E [Janthinobacterium sp. NKUCC08_JDC]|uniref:PRTRC system protein E n=1 Tax=Janthinobacterium sp. NKUCC08_JDC TaxID=2842122 RepID=UPI001C5AD9E5|nr:PRTRC system protein E [Janthinobacterium sp. NKUCC08_JDC]MBW3496957.1 PRTRC system protein E [Janthinobacterium sp. NKUCC08_JDC]
MFTTLHALTQSATLMIVVTAEGDDLRVSITPTQAGDKTKAHKLQPLSLVASPAELDDGFAAAIQSWQAPKLSLQQQVEAANAAGADPVAPPASSKSAAKEVGKRPGPGRPKKNDSPAPGGEGAAGAGADNASQQENTPPAGSDAGAAAATSTPPVGGAEAEEPEEIMPAPAGNPAITAAVDTVTLDLF